MENEPLNKKLVHSKRIEALSDGIFAIAATLLVLEIRVPEINETDTASIKHALLEIVPSLMAFVFSFLNILIFWVNHDNIGKVLLYFDSKLTYLNIIFLLFISLVPFTTAFVSRYPFELIAISCYGIVFFLTAVVSTIMYNYIAFKSNLMLNKITMKSRRKILKRVIMGPLFYACAIFLGFIHVSIPIIIYILVPMLFLVLPKIEFAE